MVYGYADMRPAFYAPVLDRCAQGPLQRPALPESPPEQVRGDRGVMGVMREQMRGVVDAHGVPSPD
jgi:hypothetical protein